MNLLPLEYKNELKFEAWRRFAFTFGLYFNLIFAAGIVLLLPSFFFLKFQIGSLEQQVSVLQISEETKELREGTQQVRSINKALTAFQNFETTTQKTGPLIDSFLLKSYPGINITSFSYTRSEAGQSELEIQGGAENRTSFLEYVDALRTDERVESVENPITNLVSEANIKFSISILFSGI